MYILEKLEYGIRYFTYRIKYVGSLKSSGMFKVGKHNYLKVRNGNLSFGKNVTTRINVAITINNGELVVGERCFFNNNCTIACRKKISIGKLCSFAPGVVIVDHDHKISSKGFETDEYTVDEIEIGDLCWIGANSIILKGTKIGKGCVISAGSVVKGTIPDYSIVKSDSRSIHISPLHD